MVLLVFEGMMGLVRRWCGILVVAVRTAMVLLVFEGMMGLVRRWCGILVFAFGHRRISLSSPSYTCCFRLSAAAFFRSYCQGACNLFFA